MKAMKVKNITFNKVVGYIAPKTNYNVGRKSEDEKKNYFIVGKEI